MKEVIENAQSDQMAGPAKRRRPYRKPTLVLYGQVATLTKSTGCSAIADNGDNCVPGGMGGYTPKTMSDRRAKEDIRQVGTHPMGFHLYVFRYRAGYRDECGDGRMFGVMADEVESVAPDAVGIRPDGFQAVDYRLLGIKTAAAGPVLVE